MPARSSISRARVIVSSMTSDGPPPASTSTDSRTSSALPTVSPRGTSIAVMRARVLTPESRPISTIVWARSLACAGSDMKAPDPVLTSSTNPPAPSAIFLLMMLEAMSGIASTVPVTSRSA